MPSFQYIRVEKVDGPMIAESVPRRLYLAIGPTF